MPIPTRSKSVKGPTTQGKSVPSQASTEQGAPIPAASIAPSTDPQVRESRLPGPGRSIPVHTRSQSSYVTIPRPTGTGGTTEVVPRSNSSTVAAHTRSRSVVTAAVPTSSQRQGLQPTPSLLRTPSQVTRPTNRPGLVTRLQQQAEPTKKVVARKVPAPSQTANAPSAAPSLFKSHSELPSRIKDELIQLALTHNESQSTLHRFEHSTEQKIKSSLSAIQAEEALVRGLEQARQANINAVALQDWSLRDEGLHDLSFCLSEISDLNSNRGLYTACIKQFEDWLSQAEQAYQQHKDGTHKCLVDPIDRVWEANMSNIAERLNVCEHILLRLKHTSPDQGSALAWTHMQLCALTASMKHAVAESQSIHGAALITQRQWIDTTVAELVAKQDRIDEVSSRIGSWN